MAGQQSKGQQRQAGPQPQDPTQGLEARTGCLPVLVRLIWMMLGNLLLFACAVSVARRTAPVLMDLAFFAVALGLIALRYIDVTRLGGETTEGKPATLAHWRRYAVTMVLVSGSVWAIARWVASHRWM